MVGPITGPFTSAETVRTASGSKQLNKLSYRQRRPYTSSLRHYTGFCENTTSYPYNDWWKYQGLWQSLALSSLPPSYATTYFRPFNISINNAYTASRSKLVYYIKSKSDASLGETFGESREALRMLVTRLETVKTAYLALRRGDIPALYRSLFAPGSVHRKGFKAPKDRLAKNMASTYLEWKFGWMPLIKDIYDAVDVLQSPIPMGRYSARTKWEAHAFLTYANKDAWCHAFGVTRLGCFAEVSNPNLWLANQMGLANPVQTVWNLIPMSFLVDWFVDVSGFLGGYSAFFGLNLTGSYVSNLIEFNSVNYFDTAYGPRICNAYGHRFERETVASFIPPSLSISLPAADKALIGRAATLAALVVQIF